MRLAVDIGPLGFLLRIAERSPCTRTTVHFAIAAWFGDHEIGWRRETTDMQRWQRGSSSAIARLDLRDPLVMAAHEERIEQRRAFDAEMMAAVQMLVDAGVL